MPEHYHQIEVVNWLRFRGHIVFSVPNLGQRSFATTNYLRSEGMTAGAPDLIVVTAPPNNVAAHVAIEMKRDERAKISAEQKFIHGQMRDAGWIVIIGTGSKNAIEQLQALGY